jgi:hypothetical protein
VAEHDDAIYVHTELGLKVEQAAESAGPIPAMI